MNFPTKQGDYLVPSELYIQYQLAYPNVDIEAEFRKMKMWLISNERKQKTTRGMPKFINHWLSKAKPKEQSFLERQFNSDWANNL